MKVDCKDLGRMAYAECLALQRCLFDKRLEGHDIAPDNAGTILLVEHPAVYTLGKRGREENMLVSEEYLRGLGVEVFRIERGGDITFHGEGQLVCYPILDLTKIGIGLRRYIEILEQSIIDTIAVYGIKGRRLEGATGVWLCDDEGGTARNWRKICAIGVRASRFVTMHGLALNVATDLNWFSMINPCGFTDKGVTSLEKEIGRKVDFEEVKHNFCRSLTVLLGVEYDTIIKGATAKTAAD